MAQGYGCWRFPLPNDSKIWKDCIEQSKYDDNSTIVDVIVGEVEVLHKEQKSINSSKVARLDPARLKQELDDCKKRYWTNHNIRRKMQYVDGIEYLKNEGYPLLEVPNSVDKEIKKDISDANKIISAELHKKEKKLASKANESIALEVSKKIAKNPDTYKEGVKKAKIALEYSIEVEKDKLKKLEKKIVISRALQKNTSNASANKDEKNLLLQRNNINAKIKQANSNMKHMDSLIKGIDVAADVLKFQGMYDNISSKDKYKNAQAILESTKLVQKYFNQFKDNVVNLNDFKKFTAKKMGNVEFDKMMQKSNILNGVSDVLGGTVKAGEYGMDVYNHYKKYEEIKKKAMKLYNSGRYTDAQANMLTAFDTMSYLTDKASGYMPPGMNDMVKFYAEAMKTPAKFDQIMRNIVNKNDSMANITGDQVHTHAMKAYEKKHGDISNNDSLDRDPYLFRKAGLSVYKMNNTKDSRPYVIMARSDKDPIYVNEKTYRKIKEMTFYYPIVYKKRLNDADLYEQLSSMGERGMVNIDDLLHKAKKVMKNAAVKKRIADMYGKKTITHEELSLWYRFNKVRNAALPKSCILDMKTTKRLFGMYREIDGKEKVQKFLSDYGKKLKSVE
jgi:hypothetical protein